MYYNRLKMELKEIAKKMVAKPHGIIAMDESDGTIGKRFAAIGVENNVDNRRAYREMIITTEGIEKYISGGILFEETLFQKLSDGRKFVDVFASKGMLAGIKVDQKALPSSPGETLTAGLEGLDERAKKYYKAGARFSKWRSVITIGEGTPTQKNTEEDMRRLAKYAKIMQNNGIVPILEPEVLMDGNHTIEKKKEVTRNTLKTLYKHCKNEGVDLAATILKPNMVVSGKDNGPDPVKLVAKETLDVLKECVPKEVGGIAFLSGGIDDDNAVAYLNEMNKDKNLPWNVTFSFARAIQNEPMKIFGTGDIKKAQKILLQKAKGCSDATKGL